MMGDVSEFQYSYPLQPSRLTQAQKQHYEDCGFLVVPQLIPHDLLDQFRERFLDICDGRVEKNQMTLMRDVSLLKQGVVSGERLVNKLQDWVYDEVLSQYCTLPQVLDIVENFIGSNIMAMHTMLINKPPDSGMLTSRHPLHQDLHYFPFRPANRIVCSWTAMERVHRENGCLVVMPGSHKLPLMVHEYPSWEKGVNKMYHGIRGHDDDSKVYVEMDKGDTVFFHPLIIHGSGANVTKNFRKAISTHYAASDCEYINVDGTSQENIKKEVEDIAKRRGVDVTFQEVWHYRSRLCRGDALNL